MGCHLKAYQYSNGVIRNFKFIMDNAHLPEVTAMLKGLTH